MSACMGRRREGAEEEEEEERKYIQSNDQKMTRCLSVCSRCTFVWLMMTIFFLCLYRD